MNLPLDAMIGIGRSDDSWDCGTEMSTESDVGFSCETWHVLQLLTIGQKSSCSRALH